MDLATFGGRGAEHGTRRLGAPRAQQAGKAKNLAAAHLKRDVTQP